MSALWEMLQRLLALACSSAKTGVPELATVLDDGYVPLGGAAANSLAHRLPGCVFDEFMELFKTASSRVSSTMGRGLLGNWSCLAQDGIGHEQAVLRLHPMQRRRAATRGERTSAWVGSG